MQCELRYPEDFPSMKATGLAQRSTAVYRPPLHCTRCSRLPQIPVTLTQVGFSHGHYRSGYWQMDSWALEVRGMGDLSLERVMDKAPCKTCSGPAVPCRGTSSTLLITA